jgi:hypothetical protein
VRLRLAALFAAVFANFLVWGLIKPPFQSPDEFAHLTKALSVPSSPWITPSFKVEIYNHFLNPLLEFPYLHQVPFHGARRFSEATIDELQAAAWSTRHDWGTSAHRSTSFIYPVVYYAAVFLLGQGATELFALSPYDSVYAFRIASAILAAGLWTLAYTALGFLGRHRAAVFALLVLQPMVGFLSSSINPDAVSFPLSALAIVTAYESIFLGRGLARAAVAMLAVLYTKSAGIFLLPPLAAIVLAAWLLRRSRRADVSIHWPHAALLIPGVFALYYATFYAWSPVVFLTLGFEESLASYLRHLVGRMPGLVVAYWGRFGWLDYGAPGWVYLLVLALLVGNAGAFAARFRTLEDRPRFAYLCAFPVLYAGALVAAEFASVSRWGYGLQGRYLLPVALGIFVVVCHPAAWLRRAFVVLMLAFNLYCVDLTVDRYYGGDWSLAWRALPFRGAGG